MKKFKVEWLGKCSPKPNDSRTCRYQTVLIDAHDPIEARDKFFAKNLANLYVYVYEVDKDGNNIHGWNLMTLAKHKDELKVQYDLKVE